MLGALTTASRPLSAAPRTPRAFKIATVAGEYGWAAWSFSRQAKLNAWSWHGLGGTRINSWAVLGSCIYMRKESDTLVHVLQPDTFLDAGVTSTDSDSVEATTQWLDFGKPGVQKALDAIDFDGKGIVTVEVYVAEGGDRAGTLAASIPIGDADAGWTYNGEQVPIGVAATEFKLRFIADPNIEAQINRLTLHWSPMGG